MAECNAAAAGTCEQCKRDICKNHTFNTEDACTCTTCAQLENGEKDRDEWENEGEGEGGEGANGEGSTGDEEEEESEVNTNEGILLPIETLNTVLMPMLENYPDLRFDTNETSRLLDRCNPKITLKVDGRDYFFDSFSVVERRGAKTAVGVVVTSKDPASTLPREKDITVGTQRHTARAPPIPTSLHTLHPRPRYYPYSRPKK